MLLLTFTSESERDRFEYLYNRYKKLCLKKAYDILHDYALAEDAVSEAFLRVYKNLRKIGEPDSGSAAAFIVTITKNVSLTLLSREKKDIQQLDEEQQDSFDLESLALSEDSVRGAYKLLDSLTEELRSVFLLKFSYDLSHKEIAKLLGISENNVTVRLHRAKKKLAELLVKEGFVGAQQK